MGTSELASAGPPYKIGNAHRMIWLPELAEESVLPRLPLSLAVGPALISLLAGGAEKDEGVARDALEIDAPLSLWTLLRAWRAGDENLRTSETLLEWLRAHASDVLVWSVAPSPVPDDEAWLSAYHRLADLSLTVARRARDLAGAAGSKRADEAYLIGLIHVAQRWFALDPAYLERSVVNEAPPGPAWLAAALGQLKERSCVDDEPVAFVARALDAVEGASPSGDKTTSSPDPSAALAALSRSLPELAAKLNDAARREREFDARLTNAKLAAMAEFAAGAGHEINNPIAVIAGRAQLLIDGEVLPDRRRELAVINTQAMRVYEMIADMMLFARPPEPRMAACNLSQLVDRVVSELAATARERRVRFDREPNAEAISVCVDANQIAVALKAICQNALDAVDKGGRVIVSLRQVADDGVEICVSDNGVGLSAEVLEHLFDPFFCGRPAGRRLGMGLSKAWRIVRNHGGQITAKNQTSAGALFTITLPASIAERG